MIIEPPDAWKKQAESTPLAVPKESEPVIDKPANEVIYLLQTISDRLTKLEEKASLPLDPLTRHVLYDLPPVDTSGLNGESVIAKFYRDSFVHDATAPPPQQPVNRDYEVTFTNEELLAQIKKLRKDNHELASLNHEQTKTMSQIKDTFKRKMLELDVLLVKTKILDSLVELVADRIDERLRDDE